MSRKHLMISSNGTHIQLMLNNKVLHSQPSTNHYDNSIPVWFTAKRIEGGYWITFGPIDQDRFFGTSDTGELMGLLILLKLTNFSHEEAVAEMKYINQCMKQEIEQLASC